MMDVSANAETTSLNPPPKREAILETRMASLLKI